MLRLIIFLLLCCSDSTVFTSPLLLIKIPTRSRPERFFATLNKHYELLSGEVDYHFLITCDSDDATMNRPEIIERLKAYPNLSFSYSINSCKVAAYNRDITYDTPFDIVLISSDDMIPQVVGYDKIIVDTMVQAFPDFDGVLNFHDGAQGAKLNTFPVMGKRYFDRFGYIYHPNYQSLFCDNELTHVSRMLDKEKICAQALMLHMHPCNNLAAWDALYIRNENLQERDRVVYLARKARLFDLDSMLIKAPITSMY